MSLYICAFSPTGTTRRTAAAVASGMEEPAEAWDFTFDRKQKIPVFSPDDLVIVGLPVYAGRIPAVMETAIRSLHGGGAACLPLVVYGNRAFEDALLELSDLLEAAAFQPLAAAAFIGEHSYDRNLAAGRPNQADESLAADFGRRAYQKWRSGGWERPAIPGSRPYKPRAAASAVWSPESAGGCTACGVCAAVCPVGIIAPEGFGVTDPAACLHCCACVKSCPEGARVIRSDAFEKTRNWLLENFAEPKQPEFYL